MENRGKIPIKSKLKAPSQLRIPTRHIASGSSGAVSKPQPEPLRRLNPTNPRLVRRSKSVSDLRGMAHRPLANFQNGPAKGALSTLKNVTASKSTINLRQPAKRPASDSSDDVKPKMIKPAKPAPYDFKAKFYLLQERHTALVLKSKESIAKANQLTEKVESSNIEIDTLNATVNNLKLNIKTVEAFKLELETNCKNLEHLNANLNNEIKNAQENITSLNSTVEVLKSSLTNCEKLCLKEQNLNKILQDKNEQLEYELNLLKKENQCLTESVSTYKIDLCDNEALRRALHNQVQDLKGNIRVFCRVRQTISDEEARMLTDLSFPDDCTLEMKRVKESICSNSSKVTDSKHEFVFDRVFPPEARQQEVFEDLAELVQSTLDGYNVCVFAYGQTGSGKTYTMQGDADNLGMIPRSMDLLFKNIAHLKKSGWEFEAEASFLEIYNETLRDLLDASNVRTLEIRYNEGKGVTVSNLINEPINSADDFKRLMFVAQKNRAVAATDFNEHSSRSHAVTKISVQGYNAQSKICCNGTLNLVDLAGSESAKTSAPERLVETKNINKSLSSLGNVMLALHNKVQHIPYRNSKLTYLLQSSLGGDSKTLMFVNIAPFDDCYAETLSSVRFASKVKEVQLGSKRRRQYK